MAPPHGDVCEYDPDGHLALRAQFVNGVLEGTLLRYAGAEGLVQRSGYRAGVLDGVTEAYADGRLQASTSYRAGLRDGPMLVYDIGGQMQSEVQFVRGRMHGAAVFFHPGGKTVARRAQYAAGLLQGEVLDYNEQGQLMVLSNYRIGQLNGERVRYHPNGKIGEVAQFRDDQLQGEPRKYDQQGVAQAAAPDPQAPKKSRLSAWIEG